LRLIAVASLLAVAAGGGFVRVHSAVAQEATAVAGQATGAVTVVGHGSVTVKPDVASVSIGVIAMQETLPGALDEANATMAAIIEALDGVGITADDVQTAYFSVSTIRDWGKQESAADLPPVIGYQVSNQVAVIIRDLQWTSGLPSEQVGEVLAAVIEAGASDIYGISFSVAEAGEAESQARALALQDAERRAEELAREAGKSLGEIVTISEGIAFLPIGFGAATDGRAGGGAGGGIPIIGGTVEIAIDVTVTYELL
jgi:uncharacterized protein YggE